MEEGGSRIRRRVLVRKRNRSLEGIGASPTAAELLPTADPEEEAGTGSRRQKTVGLEPGQQNDSEEDMFDGYDSFAENSFLAQVDDLEQKFMQSSEHVADFVTKDLCSESIQNFAGSKTNDLAKNQSGQDAPDVPVKPGDDLLFDVPPSQVLYFERLQNSLHDLGHQSTEEKDRNSLKTVNEEFLCAHVEQEPQQNDELASKVRNTSEMSRRKSVKDHLKSAMTGNAKAPTAVFSRSKHLKETLLSEEISVAKKTIESSSDDLGPFYSLPSKVRELYIQFRGIEKLYGNAFLQKEKRNAIIRIFRSVEASASMVPFLIWNNQIPLVTFHPCYATPGLLPYPCTGILFKPVILAVSSCLNNFSVHPNSGFCALSYSD